DPELCRDVELIAGEARFRHLYTSYPEQVAQRYRDILGQRAWVLTRAEAVAAGWFGTLDPAVIDHWGDVVVAARDTWAFLTTSQPGEFSLVGMHGSLTPAEMLVPLGTLHGRR
ncbi:MAG: alkaline phosphatase family protein, partial [Propionibacteriaceae bacterium]